MTVIEQLQDIYNRATTGDTTVERPLLVPFANDTRTIAIAINHLRDAQYAVAEAKKTLAFYANPKNYEALEVPSSVKDDNGMLARVALSKIDPT